ncbi:MAG: hypothetical protein KAY37_16305, partial [Phycisphaerae bacterium]|nr:hypothetical protein [Phycisphaerae bacterium]
MYMRKCVAALCGAALLGSAAPADCPDADLLVYDDAFFIPAFYAAASQLGVSYLQVHSYEELHTQLTTQTYRAVIVSGQSWENGAGWEPLLSYIAGGGHVVMSYHYLQEEPTLAAALGVTAVGNFEQGDVESVIQTATHEIWTGVVSPIDVEDTGAFDNGDRLLPLGGSESIAEFTSGGSAIVIANDGRTVINGFISDNVID